MRETTTYRTLFLGSGVLMRYTVKENQFTNQKEWFTSRAQRRQETQPRWKTLKEINQSGDKLAYRAYILKSEGRETMHNGIYMDHGLPKRY